MERYNLRSKGQEICVPVQLQMAGDGELFTQDLGSSHPDPGQVTFQSNGASDSDSELDLSDIFKNSDNEIHSPSKHGFQRGPNQQGHSGDGVACNKTVIDQNEINMQILKQLSHLGERLTNIENKGGVCKKSSDKSKIKNPNKVRPTQKAAQARSVPQGLGGVSNSTHPTFPTPGQIIADELIQQQVQERLKQLSENISQGKEKIKSQRGGSVDVFVNNRVKWPHEFILSGTNKERISYDQLSPVQWMAGFCRTMRDQPDVKIREHMLDYVIHLLEDAQDFSWSAAKASHAVLLCRMEQGEISGWTESEKIERIRRAHAQRHVTAPSEKGQKGQDKTQHASKVLTCLYFNKNTCLQKNSHETRGVLYRHICLACFTAEGKEYPHSQLHCRKSKAKNQ